MVKLLVTRWSSRARADWRLKPGLVELSAALLLFSSVAVASEISDLPVEKIRDALPLLLPPDLAIEYTATATACPPEGNVGDATEGGEFVDFTKVALDANGYYFNLISRQPNAGTFETTTAFNGRKYQTLKDSDRLLFIMDERPEKSLSMYDKVVVLLPFAFLLPLGGEDLLRTLSYSEDYSREALRDTLMKQVGEADVEVAQGNLLRIKLPGGNEPIAQKPFTYRVSLSPKDGMYPMEWERVASDGTILTSYKVVELSQVLLTTGKAWTYPKRAKLQYYENGRPAGFRDIVIESVEGLKSDEIFTLDPAIADAIVDGATGVRIAVPK